MSSAFKNSRPHRKYRERAQPQAREHLGLLEKKRDYRARAKNYHQKQDRLNQLRLKASLRNKDEFYFKMVKGKNKEGKHVQFDSDESDIDEKDYKREMKTQNTAIVTLQRSIENNKLENLKNELHFLEAPKPNKHKILVDSDEAVKNFDMAQYYNTVPELLQLPHKSNILTKEQLAMIDPEEISKLNNTSETKEKYNTLAQTAEKEAKMKKMMLKLQYEKNLLGPERRKIKKWKGQTYRKFFTERKR